jgi:hypothetical protein
MQAWRKLSVSADPLKGWDELLLPVIILWGRA